MEGPANTLPDVRYITCTLNKLALSIVWDSVHDNNISGSSDKARLMSAS